MEGVEKYVQSTTLSQNVDDWHGKIDPIIQAEKQHPPFDIHSCSDKIVSHLQQDDDPIGDEGIVQFEKVVEQLDQYQVCRMFLASLQLVYLLFSIYHIIQPRQTMATSNCIIPKAMR